MNTKFHKSSSILSKSGSNKIETPLRSWLNFGTPTAGCFIFRVPSIQLSWFFVYPSIYEIVKKTQLPQGSNLREKFTFPAEKLTQNLLFRTSNNFSEFFLAVSRFDNITNVYRFRWPLFCQFSHFLNFVNWTTRSDSMTLFLWKS